MLCLIVGCGSIGKRHIRNLKTLNTREIIAYDPQPERCREVEKEYGVRTYSSLDEALTQKPNAAFICSPTSLHVAPALAAAHHSIHLFIEKPLSHTFDGIDELINVVKQKGLVTLVGCNMRFHPSIALIKQMLGEGKIGEVLSARVQAGQYLPDWHPWEDYRRGYSAQKSLGGGIILDAIHEIDYITWLLGEVNQLVCFSGKLSSLEIDTEDIVEILLRLKSRAIIEVHLDYVQRAYGRSCQIIGEEGTVLWDFNDKQVKLYTAGTKQWQVFAEPSNYDGNQMYIDEIKHFLRCLEGNLKPSQDINDGKRILGIALAAKESSNTGKVIKF